MFCRNGAFLLLCIAVSSCSAGKLGQQGSIDISGILNPDPKATEPAGDGELEGEKDILADDEQNRNALSDPNKLWPQGIVPYVLDRTVEYPERRQMINAAIADYSRYTCIKFVPRRREADYARFRADRMGCFAWIGRHGGEQPINLAQGCWNKGTVIHEMLHTLGFMHEQARSDRDSYITVHYDQIPQDWHDQYNKLRTSEEDRLGMGYDYQSVMHYPAKTYPGKTRPSITTRDPAFQDKIGQRAGFSEQDVREVNRFYKCRGKTSGIEGINGCMDKSVDYCENKLGLKDGPGNPKDLWDSCNDPHDRDYCKKSCRRC